MRTLTRFFLSNLLFLLCSPVYAGPELEGIAARSVHLNYPVPEGEWFYIEARVDESHPGTYVCTAGFSKGYLGIQELSRGKHVVIFSVWDPGDPLDFTAHPDQVAKEKQVETLYADPEARIRRFGGEGTGGQCMLDFDWKAGEWYRFALHAEPSENQTTIYTAYVGEVGQGDWRRLASFRAREDGRRLRGTHSFVEDFRRNRVSATQVRTASFRNMGAVDIKKEWYPARKAQFSGDGNPVMNIDAGWRSGAFFLATGGETENTHTKLWAWIHAEGSMPHTKPELPSRPDYKKAP